MHLLQFSSFREEKSFRCFPSFTFFFFLPFAFFLFFRVLSEGWFPANL